MKRRARHKEFRISDFGFRIDGESPSGKIGDRKIGIPSPIVPAPTHALRAVGPQSEIRNPKSEIGRWIILVSVTLALLAMPPATPSRADEEDADFLAKYAKSVEESVDRALTFLVSKQLPEGCWTGAAGGRSTALTSLSVMAFLAKGHTPGNGPYAQVLNKGIDFVMAGQQPNGLLSVGSCSGPLGYDHAISTLMLSEVSGMLDPQRQKKLDKVLAQAVRLLLASQAMTKQPAHKGGWRYQVATPDSDISCTGWALMALRSARGNGAAVPKEAIDQAVEFILRCQEPGADKKKESEPAGFCYQPGGQPGASRTGTAVLALELCGQHHAKPALQGGEYLLAHPVRTFGENFFYYTMYYGSQATFQLGGKYWKAFAPHMMEMMLKYQQKDGSWPQGSGSEAQAGVNYSTAMSVLAITVSYRQLPIYQR